MKTIVTVLGIASLVSLAACGSQKEAAVENAYDNQADALDNTASNMEDMADNMTGNAANATEHAADAVENKADGLRDAGEKAAEKVEEKH